ncbi:MAG: hypothetical protein IKB71_09625 [Lentisphaeria bacterium]|nr:hypothetical protein [Lentisphaeria bacterium]
MSNERTLYLSRKACPENLNAIPSDAVKFTTGSLFVQLDEIDGITTVMKDRSFVYYEFELETEREVIFSAGADWYFIAYLNGELIYSTYPVGNGALFNTLTFSGKGRKGRNLLTIETIRGRATSLFFFAEGGNLAPDLTRPGEISGDISAIQRNIKYMNGINNAPVARNMKYWQQAKISYVRNHDASISGYGSAHIVDVHMIFPDFSKDPYDPASYDFVLSDKYHKLILEGGSKIFYRLGTRIEHEPKKYGTIMPPDFKKWAVICEHIVRHYTEGWADGFNWDVEYWEIWNEADMSSTNENKCTWSGTDQEFFEMYKITALHLKKNFPHLKIGGPALACTFSWMKDFLAYMSAGERCPIDFFSWHIYGTDPDNVEKIGGFVQSILQKYGYGDAENILNEWNYIRAGVPDGVPYNQLAIHGMKGAAFAMSAMLSGQNSVVDMLMYYDARTGTWYNGIFDFYTQQPLKTFYDFVVWSKLMDLGKQFELNVDAGEGIRAVGATDENGKAGIALCRYFEQDEMPAEIPVTIRIKGKKFTSATALLLDEDNDLTETNCTCNADGSVTFNMKGNSVVYVEG